MAITGISAIGNQQIIAAGAKSATKAYQDSNGYVITSKYQTTANMSNYQTTAGMSNYQTTAGMSNYATTASITGKQDTLTFGYTNDQISQINGSAIYSQSAGGGGVVTATGGYGTYVTSINEKPISGLGLITSISTGTYNHIAGQPLLTAVTSLNNFDGILAVSSISASMTNLASSATSAYKLTDTAIKVASAASANYALAVSNGVTSTTVNSIVYTASLPSSPAANTLYLIPE